MSFSPPNTFADGTVCTSAALEGNYQALRVYLHGGIVSGDVEAAQWIDTRHIQPPSYEPYSAVQHGVSGHQGGIIPLGAKLSWSISASVVVVFRPASSPRV